MGAGSNYLAPQNIHVTNHRTERSVIVTLLAPTVSDRARKHLLLRLRPEMFSAQGQPRAAFLSIQAFVKQFRRMPDLETLQNDHRVRASIRLWLAQGSIEPMRTRDQVDNAVEGLTSFMSKRELWDGYSALIQTCESDTYDEAAALRSMQAIVRKLSRPLGMSELDLSTDDPETRARVREVLKRSQQVQSRKFATGWPTVDRILSGGLAPSELLLLAANTGGGKSMVALAMAMYMVEHGANVVYFSFEMREDAVFLRLACRWAGFTRAQLASGQLTAKQLSDAHDAYMTMLGNCTGTLRVLTPERGFARPTLDYLEDVINRKPTDVVFVDYMSMLGEQAGSHGDNEEKRLRAASEGLVMLGASAQVAVVAMAQLDDEGRVKYSRGVRDAATMLLQWDSTQSDTADDRGVCYRVEIKKQRETAGPPVKEFFVEPQFDNLRVPEREAPAALKQTNINDMGDM